MNDEQFELTISDLAGSGTYYADIADELRDRDLAQREDIKRLESSLAHACVLLGEADYQARLWEDYQTENEMEVEDHWVTSQVRDRIYKFLDGFKVAELVRSTYSFPRLVSWSEQMSTCTLVFEEREYYFDLHDDCKDDDFQEAQGEPARDFQREDRYIVIKRKDLEKAPFGDRVDFQGALDVLVEHLPKREYLVIESDWPEYEPTWAAIQARMTGQGAQAGDEEHPECFCVEHGLHIETLQQQLAEARAALATQPAEQLWAVHAQGPDDLFAAFSREDAEAFAAGLNALPCPPGISVSAVVIESPWPAAEHWKYLAEQWKYLADKEQESNSRPAAVRGAEQ